MGVLVDGARSAFMPVGAATLEEKKETDCDGL